MLAEETARKTRRPVSGGNRRGSGWPPSMLCSKLVGDPCPPEGLGSSAEALFERELALAATRPKSPRLLAEPI
jgi:hypothetical protein